MNAGDTANGQKTLSYYCQVSAKFWSFWAYTHELLKDNIIDVIPVAFVNVFIGIGGAPSMDLAHVRDLPAFNVQSIILRERYLDLQPY